MDRTLLVLWTLFGAALVALLVVAKPWRHWRPKPRFTVGGDQIYEANAELILSGPPTEPLAQVSLKGEDPLQPFAEIFADLRDQWHEHLTTVDVDVMAIPNARVRRLREYWMRQAPGTVAKGNLSEPETGRTPTGVTVQRRQDVSRLASKLDPTEILFEVQVLLHVESTRQERPTEIMRGFLTAFGQWKGANEFTVYGNVARFGVDLMFFGSDRFPWRRAWHRTRRHYGIFWPSRISLVAAWEIGGFLKPWSKWNASEAPWRSGGIVPSAPVELGQYNGAEELGDYPIERPAEPPSTEETAAVAAGADEEKVADGLA